jgi:hypothetical protein
VAMSAGTVACSLVVRRKRHASFSRTGWSRPTRPTQLSASTTPPSRFSPEVSIFSSTPVFWPAIPPYLQILSKTPRPQTTFAVNPSLSSMTRLKTWLSSCSRFMMARMYPVFNLVPRKTSLRQVPISNMMSPTLPAFLPSSGLLPNTKSSVSVKTCCGASPWPGLGVLRSGK